MNLTGAAMIRLGPVAQRVSLEATPLRRLTGIMVLCLWFAASVHGTGNPPTTGDWP